MHFLITTSFLSGIYTTYETHTERLKQRGGNQGSGIQFLAVESPASWELLVG